MKLTTHFLPAKQYPVDLCLSATIFLHKKAARKTTATLFNNVVCYPLLQRWEKALRRTAAPWGHCNKQNKGALVLLSLY
jgi:hypothetical protein